MDTRFELGQPCIVKPVTFNAGNEFSPRHERGTILYVHPKMRYLLVGVSTPSGQLRECFFPEKVHPVEKKKNHKR